MVHAESLRYLAHRQLRTWAGFTELVEQCL
ncbi:hypothetical protein N806_29100 [Rhodococcus sp. P27]|nr:hypothetical protein N601_07350 [Rhodococcus erythropolis DN1]ERB55186.1 hypothetical protein N806_29100 [Rhodococcus sp. P27]